jgi:hypothetical protein
MDSRFGSPALRVFPESGIPADITDVFDLELVRFHTALQVNGGLDIWRKHHAGNVSEL